MATKNKQIIAPVGLAGSGKSTIIDYFTSQGIPKVYMGGVIYDLMKEAGIDITWDSQKKFREEIRKAKGQDFILQQVIKNIHQLFEAGQKKVVMDGLYTWPEYKTLLSEFPGQVTVVAVVAPKHLRYQRLKNRPERPMQPREAKERDWAEIENMSKGGPIAMADFFIINDSSIDDLHKQLDSIVNTVHFCKAPAQC